MKSYKEIAEALKGKQHKIDKNKNGKIDAHDFKLLRKEETELTEATVKTQKYSWGTMKTIHHGADFSIPLHPEHHQAIAKLKDEQEHKFKTEDGKHWTARRKGEEVHFHSGNDGPKTMVKHSALKEETDLEEGIIKGTIETGKQAIKVPLKAAKRVVKGVAATVGGVVDTAKDVKDGVKTIVKKFKEEKEDDEDRMARSDYKVSPSGRKSHKEIVFKHGDSDKKDLEERTMTDAEMKKREEIVKSMKKNLAGFKDRYGDRAKDVMYATATKMAMKEETIEEKKVPEATGDLKDACWKGYTAVGMKMKNGRKVPNCVPVKEEAEELDEISKELAGNYYGKATQQHLNKVGLHSNMYDRIKKDMGKKRKEGVDRALDRIVGIRKTNEEVEELDERNKQNATMRKMMDASRGAKFKAQGNYVPDPEPQHKTAQAHNKAIGRAIRQMSKEEVKKDDAPFDGPYTKVKGDVKDKSGATHTPMSRAKHLARMAMKKRMKEDIDRLFEAKEKTEYDFEGDMARGQLQSIVNNAQKVHDMLKDNDNLPEWVQSKITLAEDYISTVSNYMMAEIDEQAPVAPVPGMKFKNHAVMVHPETKSRLVINRKNIDNYTSDGYKEVRPGQKLKEDDEVKFSYIELMMMLEYESKDGVYRHTGTYGSEYAKKEREKDEKGFDSDDKPTTSSTQKRGRGRPAGSKSGARGPRIK